MLRRLLPPAVRPYLLAWAYCGVCLCAAPTLADEPIVGGAADRAAQRRPHGDLARQIDLRIDAALTEQNVPPSPRADDGEFLRRVSLDLAGTIPTLERTIAFFADSRPDKRARVVDELLASPEYVRHMTDQWREHLIPGTAAAARRRHETGLVWLEDAFQKNLPYDQFVRGVLTADGMQRDNGAVTFLLTHQSLDEATDRLSRVLLGVQITCAQCHDHPFADWKQDHYWGVAAFFSKVRHQYERINNVEHYGVSERGDRKPLMTPPSFKATPPTFLDGVQPTLDPSGPYLPVFVDWLASDDNQYFARAFVNRLWRKLMGRGLVEPVDDLRDANPGTHPELLALLAAEFRRSGFDIHYLLRAITASETYQRTSRSIDGNREDAQWYSHMPIKVLSPYALGDSIQNVMRLGDPPAPAVPTPAPSASTTNETKAADDKLKAAIRARSGRDSFAGFFKGEENASPLAYEVGVPQALRLMNAQEMQRGSRVVAALRKKDDSPAAVVEQLYLAALTRRPNDDELRIALRYVESRPEANRALADVVWALLNSTEFTANH